MIVLICLLVSCQTTSDNSSTNDLDTYFLSKANEVIIDGNQVRFYDDSGRNVEIVLSPGYNKVMSLYASYTTLWYEAGGQVMASIGGNNAISLYEEYIGYNILDSGVAVVASNSAGSSFSLEKIFSLTPDFIVASNAMNGYNTIGPAVIAAGIPIIAVDYNDFADYLKWFKVFAFLNNRMDLYESVALQALIKVKETITSSKGQAQPKVLTIFPAQSSPTACTSKTLIGTMLEELGALNVVSDTSSADKVPLNLEAIYQVNPDLILVNCHNTITEAQKVINSYLGPMPLWQNLTAVKEDKLIYLPKELFHNKPNSRFAEAYELLLEILYN